MRLSGGFQRGRRGAWLQTVLVRVGYPGRWLGGGGRRSEAADRSGVGFTHRLHRFIQIIKMFYSFSLIQRRLSNNVINRVVQKKLTEKGKIKLYLYKAYSMLTKLKNVKT